MTITVETIALTKRYGAFAAVDGLSLQARAGEVMALLGPNGAGKTTLMRMLAGLLAPDGGEVQILGQRHGALRIVQRTRVGYAPQALMVWQDLTGDEQLRFVATLYGLPRREAAARVDSLLERLQLKTKARVLARKLSGGMQRRLSVALAMVHAPQVLILDEPAAGLDPQSRLLVRGELRRLASEEGRTVFVSTHHIDEAERLADRVAIIDHGRLLALADPLSLKATGTNGRSIIEVDLTEAREELVADVLHALRELSPQATRRDATLVVPTDRATTLVCPVTTAVGRCGAAIREVRVRERSLEDVFIELTGRSLRE